ncbi:hypothetical protein C5167_036056 [Papaver somniferum]|nr:hypothetical protein C5167_036056 [Papaver somniferum]
MMMVTAGGLLKVLEDMGRRWISILLEIDYDEQGKKNLDKAIESSKDQFDFEVRWHPYMLNPSAPKEGVLKRDFYREKFGPRVQQIEVE